MRQGARRQGGARRAVQGRDRTGRRRHRAARKACARRLREVRAHREGCEYQAELIVRRARPPGSGLSAGPRAGLRRALRAFTPVFDGLCPAMTRRESHSALISTLRNLITPLSLATPAASLLPRPCCSAITPLACLLSFPSTVFLPFSTIVKVSPLAVISYTFHWPTDFGIGSTLATPTIAPVA